MTVDAFELSVLFFPLENILHFVNHQYYIILDVLRVLAQIGCKIIIFSLA